MSRVDRQQAAAESGLDRVDDEEFRPGDDVSDTDAPADPQGGVDPDGFGFHVDDPEVDLLVEDLDAGLRDDAEADALDAIAETFNARDLEALLDLLAPDGEAPDVLGYDRENLPQAIEDLWERRPTCTLTRGRAELEHVGVLWEHDGSAWWPLAVLHVDDVQDGVVGVLELTVDPVMIEQLDAEPPDEADLEEGARWAEWDEGADAEDQT